MFEDVFTQYTSYPQFRPCGSPCDMMKALLPMCKVLLGYLSGGTVLYWRYRECEYMATLP
eukprot:1140284-Pelagomonas_calceolata.AAC.2